MSDSQHRVTFQPQGRAVSVLDGTTVLEAAAVAGLVIDTPCGGAGTCGKCRVQVAQGATEPCELDRKTFTEAELAEGWRLACQNLVNTDMVVHALVGRVRSADDGSVVFVSTEPDGGTTHRSLSLTQRDIRELQLGSGAIRAGVSMLLRKAGLTPADLKTVLIAGGFGGFIRRDNAQRLGLLPPDVHHERIHYVGNVSLAGARWALLSLEARKHGEELARRARHVELSVDGDFQMEFAEAMIFPDRQSSARWHP